MTDPPPVASTVPPTSTLTGASIVLPHTAVTAPHHRFAVCDLTYRTIGLSITSTATVLLDGHPVGRITHRPRHTTLYRPLPNTTCPPAQMAAYAAACRDPDGEPMSVSDVLTALTIESETADVITELEAQHLTPVRLVPANGSGPSRLLPFGVDAFGGPPSWPALVAALHRTQPPQPGGTYQIWHAERWHTLPHPHEATNQKEGRP